MGTRKQDIRKLAENLLNSDDIDTSKPASSLTFESESSNFLPYEDEGPEGYFDSDSGGMTDTAAFVRACVPENYRGGKFPRPDSGKLYVYSFGDWVVYVSSDGDREKVGRIYNVGEYDNGKPYAEIGMNGPRVDFDHIWPITDPSVVDKVISRRPSFQKRREHQANVSDLKHWFSAGKLDGKDKSE